MRPSELPLRPSELSLRLSPLPLRLSHLPLSPSQQPLRPSHTDRKKDGQEGKTSGRIDKDGQNGRPAGITDTFKDFLKKRFSWLFILCLLHLFSFLILFYTRTYPLAKMEPHKAQEGALRGTRRSGKAKYILVGLAGLQRA